MKFLKKIMGKKSPAGAGKESFAGGQRSFPPTLESDGTLEPHELSALHSEIAASGSQAVSKTGSKKMQILPTGIPGFDALIERRGLERGSTILVSGGAGSGKTTFCMQSMFEGCKRGEKGIYLSMEEDTEKIREHMLENFGFDFAPFEKKGLFAFVKMDALEIARTVEATLLREKEKLLIELHSFDFPFKPDRVAVDSLSALSISFEKKENYRKYIRYLFEKLESYNSVNYFITETEQNPSVYSRAGIEEFLADAVIVLYNIKVGNSRRQALEILKLRSSKHEKRIIPYEMTEKGFAILPNEKIF